jgi:hypothetical protein
MRKFDFYEFAGVIVPGAVVLMAGLVAWPDQGRDVKLLELSAGALGLLLIAAYVVGQLLQAVGNLLETVWWKLWGGWPSSWPVTNRGNLLAEAQRAKLQELIHSELGYAAFQFQPSPSPKEWHPIFREIYARVRSAGRDDRVHVFNGNYGMFRGIAAAAFIGAVVILFLGGCASWRPASAFAVGGSLALVRMHRFAKYYAQETLVQFLALPRTEQRHDV